MPGLIILPDVVAAMSGLQLPTATTQIVASAVLALLIVFSATCLRQSGDSRWWVSVFKPRRARARRHEITRRAPPRLDRDNSDSPSPV